MDTNLFAKKIRYQTLLMLYNVGFGHLGPSMSIVEVLAVLFNDILDFDLANYQKIEKDYFILSKGHAGPAYYSTLMLKGFISEKELNTLNQNNTRLPSHPDRLLTKGVSVTTGSLGQGISQAVGIAKGLKIKNIKNRVYCIIGDGEFNEGQTFEALSFAKSQNLDNFVAIIDNNKKQLDGYTEDISNRYNFKLILEALGYDVETSRGDDVYQIKNKILKLNENNKNPKALILNTTKGQGISHFSEMLDNHHNRFDEEDLEQLKEYLNDEEHLKWK